MKTHQLVKRITRLFLLAGILTNTFLSLYFMALGEKANTQMLYLAIYTSIGLLFPALLVLVFWIIIGLIERGFSKTVDDLKIEFVLAFLAIFTLFGLIIVTHYFID